MSACAAVPSMNATSVGRPFPVVALPDGLAVRFAIRFWAICPVFGGRG